MEEKKRFVFKLDDEWYKALKWLCLLVLPGLEFCVGTILSAWGVDPGLQMAISKTINAIATFIGICIGVSNYNYYKKTETL